MLAARIIRQRAQRESKPNALDDGGFACTPTSDNHVQRLIEPDTRFLQEPSLPGNPHDARMTTGSRILPSDPSLGGPESEVQGACRTRGELDPRTAPRLAHVSRRRNV